MEENTSTNLFELHIDHQSSAFLSETARWTKFLAILGFIFCGLCLLVALFGQSFIMSSFNRYGLEGGSISGVFVSIFYIVFAVVCFLPFLFLYRFGNKMQIALRNNDQSQLTSSFGNLRAYYRFIGILTIVMIALYLLFILFVIIGVATAARA